MTLAAGEELQETDAEAQRARLLAGLAASIGEKGLAQTQVGDIVRHARASRRTFYKHFPDKDSCFVELAHRTAELVLATVQAAVDREAPPLTQIGQAIDAYVEILTRDRAMTLTLLSPAVGERIVSAQRSGIERFTRFFEQTVQADAARGADLTPISFERAYILVTGLREAIVRALERGEDPACAAAEGKALLKEVFRL